MSNSKQRRWRELKKKKESCIEGRGTPTDLQNTCGEGKTKSLIRHMNLQLIEEEREDSESHTTKSLIRHMNLQLIEEEREDSESHATSIAESEHHNNSYQSGSL